MRLLLSTFLLYAAFLSAFGQNPPILPDPKLTPGDVLPVTREDICTPGYSSKVRDVPEKVKEEAYRRYGITSHKPHEYEVDHLISLELGGSNRIENLWPQSYLTSPWNAKVKDALENRLHSMVCKGEMDLKTAQQLIAKDWIAAYKKYVGGPLVSAPYPKPVNTAQTKPASSWPFKAAATPAPIVTKPSSPSPTLAPNASETKVWVNTRSGIYFRQGERFYGKTKEGEYMSEAEAKAKGYHAAKE